MTKRSSKSKSKTTRSASSGSSTPSAAATSRTRARREERKQQKRQQQQFLIIGAIVILAVIIGGVFLIVNQPASAPIPDGTLDRYNGIPQTVSEEGNPVLGNPDAPVRLKEFSSFACSSCEQFVDTNDDLILDQVKAGVISVEFSPLPNFGALRNGRGAARAALCAGEQGAFWEYHDVLFDWHTRFGNTAFTQNRLESGAENLGLDTGRFNSCVTSGRIEDLIQASESEATDRAIGGTPAVFVNGTAVADPYGALDEAISSAFAATGLPAIPLDLGEAIENTPEATEEMVPEETEAPDEAVIEETPEVTKEPTEADMTEEATDMAETTPEATAETSN